MATLSDVGGLPGIGAGFLQPKQKNKWRARFLGFGFSPNSLPMSLQAQKVTRPELKFEKHTMHRYNSRANVLGKHEFTDLELTVMDDLGGTASSLIRDQIQRQQYLIGAEGPYLAAAQEGRLYKFATMLDMLNGDDIVVETWTYEGCMITNYKSDELDYSSSDVVNIQLTIAVDHAYQTYPNKVVTNQALGGSGIGLF